MIFSRSFTTAVVTLMMASLASKAAADADVVTNSLRGASSSHPHTDHSRDLQDSPFEPNGICTDSTIGQKFNDVPNNGVRTLSNSCPVGEILLTYECITGGGGIGIVDGFGCSGNGCGITFSDNGSPVFKEQFQETKFIESSLPDGRRVATGVTCGMVHDNSEIAFTKKDATLITKITCGKPEDFPDVVLDKSSERKRRVGAGKNRNQQNTCPSGTEIFESTCNVGGNGSFKFRSQATFSDNTAHRCTFKNGSGSRKTATMTTSMICGDFDRAEQRCNLSNRQDRSSS